MKKRILITGGGNGIGLACAKYLIGTGYEVLITDCNEQNLTSALGLLGRGATGFLSDTASLPAIDKLVVDIKKQFGQIEGLFVNAGVFWASTFEDTTEELFDKTMGVNFKGAFFTVQKFVPILSNPSSVVLNTSVAVDKAFANTVTYTASKAALGAIAKVLNVELGPKGIRVNVISPGFMESGIQGKSGMGDETTNMLLKHFADISPLGRIVCPNDVGPVLEFLFSDKSLALRNVKIKVDGGATA